MIPGFTYLYPCKGCKGAYWENSWLSMSSFVECITVFSDGEARSEGVDVRYPRASPDVGKCSHCGVIQWFGNRAVVACLPPGETPSSAADVNAERLVEMVGLTCEDGVAALRKASARSGRRQRILHRLIWQGLCDQMDLPGEPSVPAEPVVGVLRAQSDRLAVDGSDEHRLDAAEIMRNIGNFARCLALLKTEVAEGHRLRRDAIRDAARRGEQRRVVVMRF